MNTNVIEGNPTKKFFIEMITRDISIEDAIIDFLDNSIDGATQINPDNFNGFIIDSDCVYLLLNCLSFPIYDSGIFHPCLLT